MNQQINLRLPQTLLTAARKYAFQNGFGSLQEFIKETIRDKIFPEPELTKKERDLIEKLIKVSEKRNLYGTEEELFKILRK